LYFGRRAGTLRGMPRKRHHKPVLLTEDERRTLEQWTRRPTTAQRLALRSRMVLACAEGLTNRAVAKRLHVSSNSVCKWRERFRVRRLPGLTDEPRPGAPRKAIDDRIVDVITRTLEGPPAHATQWTTRSLADAAGLDTVASQSSYMWLHLATHAEHRLRIVSDPAVIPSAAEELMRAYPIIQTSRKAIRDAQFHGCPVKKGDMALFPLAAAGRDEQAYPHARSVDFDRGVIRHLTFGAGPHRCLGSHLARQELTVLLEEWHRLIPDYELVELPNEHSAGVWGLESLPLQWKV